MSDYCYIDFSIKLKSDQIDDLSCVFIKGAIIKSLLQIFGEIGGNTEFDLLKFDEHRRKGIIRVPADFSIKLRIALTLISEFQGVSAIFQVHKATNTLPALIDTFIEF
ncbi:hypothetical protein PVAND_001217 [Polypedilum vanderplanki]|uniref:Uncharacterized protein n=1 Tax=Polypedilum vanderplanki TaxID=319348 RepID=A0A9J6BMP8_POLVA|nr:hypothetical protein PVAND_001217 [Polypedilum vanderplanki]